MNEKTKESKFLDAINKYAEKQKAIIDKEIDDYKAEKVEQATQRGLNDAYELIRAEVSQRKAAIVTEESKREQQLRNNLFTCRTEICDQVFALAKERLIAFTKTPDYIEKLLQSAQMITDALGADAIICYSPADADKLSILQANYPETDFQQDSNILIGGLRGYSQQSKLAADDTLDTKLHDQREWFIENSGLKVV